MPAGILSQLKLGRTSAPRLPQASQTNRGFEISLDVVRSAIPADRDRVAAMVVRAIDQDAAHAGVGGVNIAAAHLQLLSLGVSRLWTCRRSRNISAAPRFPVLAASSKYKGYIDEIVPDARTEKRASTIASTYRPCHSATSIQPNTASLSQRSVVEKKNANCGRSR